VPERDYFACSEDEIAGLTSALTVVGGKVVYGSGDFARFDASAPPPAMPDWSPVRAFGGYAAWAAGGQTRPSGALQRMADACGCGQACGVHGHQHARSWSSRLPTSDFQAFWGALGCACWAV